MYLAYVDLCDKCLNIRECMAWHVWPLYRYE